MHVAVAVGTMLLGSWVLNAPVDEEEMVPEDQIEVPLATPTRPTTPYMTTPRQDRSNRMGGRRIPGAGGEQGTQDAGGQAAKAGRPLRQQGRAPMPFSPTDTIPPGAEALFGQPTAPTSGMSSAGPGVFGSGPPLPPTQRPSMVPSTGLQQVPRNALDQNRGAPPLRNSGAMMGPAGGEKAFSGYRPTSGVSPYMNLFRTDTNQGTVDNYTSLVRPQIEQRYLNQQFNRDIRGLEYGARSQGLNLQQLYRSNQTLQGVSSPQYYMNYGNYYPGANQ